MRIAVVAADGRSGRAFVAAAVAAGHTVRAGILGTDTFAGQPNIEAMHCDATRLEDLLALIAGQDAVVSFIGHVQGSPPSVQTVAMKCIVQAMRQQHLQRLVSLTGTGVRFAGDHITLLDRILNLTISSIDPARVKDGKQHAEVMKASGLDWTIVRVLKLQNGAPRPFMLRQHGPTKLYVSRQEVAQAVLQVLEEHSFRQQAPIIGRAD